MRRWNCALTLFLLFMATPASTTLNEARSPVVDQPQPASAWWTTVAAWLGLDHLLAADAIGPDLDPNGVTAPPDDGERGPGLDPDGRTATGGEDDRGPELDPDG